MTGEPSSYVHRRKKNPQTKNEKTILKEVTQSVTLILPERNWGLQKIGEIFPDKISVSGYLAPQTFEYFPCSMSWTRLLGYTDEKSHCLSSQSSQHRRGNNWLQTMSAERRSLGWGLGLLPLHQVAFHHLPLCSQNLIKSVTIDSFSLINMY